MNATADRVRSDGDEVALEHASGELSLEAGEGGDVAIVRAMFRRPDGGGWFHRVEADKVTVVAWLERCLASAKRGWNGGADGGRK